MPITKQSAEQFPNAHGDVIEMVPFTRLVLPELLVEICTYAMISQDGTKLPRHRSDPEGLFQTGKPFSQGLQSGKMIMEQGPAHGIFCSPKQER